MNRERDNREKLNSLNELTGLVERLVDRNVLIDLRNETSVAGTVIHVDGYMNISLENVVYIDQKGKQFLMDNFMIYPKYLRCIHLPPEMNVVHELQQNIASYATPTRNLNKKRTFKQKRAQENQRLTLAENKML
ncbi:U7 snRNA-associated Sm-like protein LSm10 [Anopheles albimanus]|uniref:Sm domain-containing protein n=1 Tax=Anopheles albimanus TaxID=7167 RepID=A0A8W7K9U1_ANOAL|nr:U7 snRNA-associated Sm-like protein LSm10 [Anopheles albimanus]